MLEGGGGRRRRVVVVVVVVVGRIAAQRRWWWGRGGRGRIVVVVVGEAAETHLRTADEVGNSSSAAGRRGRDYRGEVVDSAVADSDSALALDFVPALPAPLLAHC